MAGRRFVSGDKDRVQAVEERVGGCKEKQQECEERIRELNGALELVRKENDRLRKLSKEIMLDQNQKVTFQPSQVG